MFRIKRNVIALGVTSFFTDVSSEMIRALMPLFLMTLGAGRGIIGLVEGTADGAASILKVFSGWLSDRTGKRKVIVAIGYSLSTLAKPFVAVADNWVQVLGIRLVDRTGKGFRDAPRDALLADSCEVDERGVSFGFHRAMDTAGAVVGTLLASLLLFIFSRFFALETVLQYRTIFWISIIPGVLSVLTIILFVKEIAPGKGGRLESSDPLGIKFSRSFVCFLLAMVLFEFANFSYALFILRAADLGVAIALIPIIYLVYNLVYGGLSIPVGEFSDRYGRKKILLAGFLIFSFMSMGFAFSTSPWQAWVLFAVYGFAVAIVETIPRAMISDFVPSEIRGTAYGVYHTLVGLATLIASAIAGVLWDIFGKVNGPVIAFSYGAILALAAAFFFWLLVPEK